MFRVNTVSAITLLGLIVIGLLANGCGGGVRYD